MLATSLMIPFQDLGEGEADFATNYTVSSS